MIFVSSIFLTNLSVELSIVLTRFQTKLSIELSTLLTRLQTELSVELKLVYEGGEVSDVSHVPGHVVLGAGIKLLVGPGGGRGEALDLIPQLPPVAVHVVLGGHPRVHVPPE